MERMLRSDHFAKLAALNNLWRPRVHGKRCNDNGEEMRGELEVDAVRVAILMAGGS